MANIILAKTFIDYTVLSATSSEGDFVKENIKEYKSPFVVWKATGTALQDITFDMGSAKSDVKIFLNNINIPNVDVKANATDSWGSPTFNESIVVNKNHRVDRRMGYFDLGLLATFTNLRYIRLTLPASQTTDDGDNYKLGALVIVDTVVELDTNFTSLVWRFFNPKKISRQEDSNIIMEEIRVSRKHFSMDLTVDTSIDENDSGRQKIFDYMINSDDGFIIFINQGFSQQSGLMRLTSSSIREILNRDAPTRVSLEDFTFEEFVY
jgi:hypothetical protein